MQQAVNTESSSQASSLSARMEALKALQDKVRTDGKLQPWLRKHGLDTLAGLVEPASTCEQGWENALEAALRERLGALEVSRLDMVRAFDHDAPPAKLVFYSPPAAARPKPPQRCRACRICCALTRCRPGCAVARLAAWLLYRRQPGGGPGIARRVCSPAR